MKYRIILIAVLLAAAVVLSGCSISRPNQFSVEAEPEISSVEESEESHEESKEEEIKKEEKEEEETSVKEITFEDSEIRIESEEVSEEPQLSEEPEEQEEPEESEESKEPEEPETKITGGTSQDQAQMLLPGIRYTGTYEGSGIWTAFTTGHKENVPYTITLENLTVGSENLYIYLYDEEGSQVYPTQRNNNDYNRAFCIAEQNGTANSGASNELKPDTTYFIRLTGLGYADDPFVRGADIDANGNFVETEGAKNRRVVVLDAEDEIALQILGN